MRSCENCGWLEINPSGAMFCGYSEERTWKDECCMAWKYKDELKTNADRIRAMSDEELADWLGVYCNGQTAQGVGKPCIKGMGSCEECWLDWLKQEIDI